MDIENRVELSNHPLAAQMGSNVIIGNCFAFVKPELFESSAFSWMSKLLGRKASKNMSIVSLFDPHGVELAGVKIKPANLGKFELYSISSDKSLYKSDEDTVDLLLINPLMAKTSVLVKILQNNTAFMNRYVELGKHGEGKLSLQDLPSGEYEVFFDGSNDRNRSCKFTVAQYRLVPLVASLQSRNMDSDGSLEMKVRLSSYGADVDGPVSIELFEEGSGRQLTMQANAVNGLLIFKINLKGKGNHYLNFQLIEDPVKTASLPIIGSRETERSKTLFNPLGTELYGSLLPSEAAQEIRGIYLSEGGITSTPLRLELDDDGHAFLKTTTGISTLKIVSIDTDYPKARHGAMNPSKAEHPSNSDQIYNSASKFFAQGNYKDALELFLKARDQQENPHPYYAYYAACCYAKLKDVEEAFTYLKLSITDGWNEFEHMIQDDDLETIKNDPRFQELATGGFIEHQFEDLPANHIIEIPACKTLTVLAIAAIIKGEPWEGWTSYISPSRISLKIENEIEYKSGQNAEIKILVDGVVTGPNNDCACYVIVKDARLLSQDKTEARLAAAIKEYVESGSKALGVSYPKETAQAIASKLIHKISPPGGGGWGYATAAMSAELSGTANDGSWGGWGGGNTDSWGASGNDGWGAGGSVGGLGLTEAEAEPAPPQSRLSGMLGGTVRNRASSPTPSAPPAAPSFQAEQARPKLKSLKQETVFNKVATQDHGAKKDLADRAEAEAIFDAQTEESTLPLQKGHEPEVLFADFVPLINGQATLGLFLPMHDSDYVLECFVISDSSWSSVESKFRSVCDPLAEFSLPKFVCAGESALSSLYVASKSKELKCRLYHNDKELELKLDDSTVCREASIKKRLSRLEFSAGSGIYKAVICDSTGKTLLQIKQTVDEPGKLQRRVRKLKLLKEGESFDIKSDASATAIRVMPGVKDQFNLLVDATTNYSHCCCEQTAAKIMSACAMFMFAGDDQKNRDRAEAAIIAGLKREESMWLPSRGFKAYPERDNTPDKHYGPQAAQHLTNLALLEEQSSHMSRDLRKYVELGLKMADDALKAYNIEFPASKFASMKDAYNACRFSNNGIIEKALSYARSKTASTETFLNEVPKNPYWGYRVNSRMEAAYAAALLIRQRNAADLNTALALANYVIGSFNAEGRLYSTLDSVAAVALFSEMIAARLAGGGGKAEINGVMHSLESAVKHAEEIKTVCCKEGIVSIEIESLELEDWSEFQAQLPLRVALEKNGQAQRAFKLGDQVDLRVKLEEGYKDGDLLWVCLPDCLSKVAGGGQQKMFSVDFAGNNEIVLCLAVTGVSQDLKGKKAHQSLAVCVRNMYDEERGGNPGLIPVSASKE